MEFVIILVGVVIIACAYSIGVASAKPIPGSGFYKVSRDGRVLVNHLQGVCSDLRFEGFSWVVRGTEDICENQQSLQVLRSGQTDHDSPKKRNCLAGSWMVQLTAASKSAAASAVSR